MTGLPLTSYAVHSLQRFKLNIASSVVNQQNAGLATMNTNQVLDLFDVTDSDAVDKKQSEDGPVSQSELLKQCVCGSASVVDRD